MPLYDLIAPDADRAGLSLGTTDLLLCQNIEAGMTYLGQSHAPFKGLNASYEEEFFVPRRGVPIVRNETLEKVDPAVFMMAARDYHGATMHPEMQWKVEVAPIKQQGRFPNQQECLQNYFAFRAKAEQDVNLHFPDYYYRRFSNHLHVSLRDENGFQVERYVNPNFVRLFEASLRLHWQAALPIVVGQKQLDALESPKGGNTSAYINRIVSRDHDTTVAYEDYFIMRRDSPYHYEIRRLPSGRDGTFPFNKMLVSQSLVACSANVALEAYKSPAIRQMLERGVIQLNRGDNALAYGKYPRALIDGMAQHPILTLPRSLGPILSEQLAQDVEQTYSGAYQAQSPGSPVVPQHNQSVQIGDRYLPSHLARQVINIGAPWRRTVASPAAPYDFLPEARQTVPSSEEEAAERAATLATIKLALATIQTAGQVWHEAAERYAEGDEMTGRQTMARAGREWDILAALPGRGDGITALDEVRGRLFLLAREALGWTREAVSREVGTSVAAGEAALASYEPTRSLLSIKMHTSGNFTLDEIHALQAFLAPPSDGHRQALTGRFIYPSRTNAGVEGSIVTSEASVAVPENRLSIENRGTPTSDSGTSIQRRNEMPQEGHAHHTANLTGRFPVGEAEREAHGWTGGGKRGAPKGGNVLG